ncbi:MAG: winged helix-turn-helix domain-containing protein, partial [Bryobacteraceae bacterium]
MYEFGSFRIDSAERLLFRGEELIPLTPKAIDTLLALLSQPGRVLEKDDLIKMVWRDSFVEEGGLARNISSLRKVFSDAGGDVQFIETIPKRGYRFVAPVKETQSVVEGPVERPQVLDLPPPPQPVPKTRFAWIAGAVLLVLTLTAAAFYFTGRLASSAPRFNSIVVLPLNHPSNDPGQEFFADGMTEELINSLAKIEALRVISRTSAMTYKGARKPLPQIARELNVDTVVEGSVTQSGGRVRITVQLFEARTERQLWAQSYEQGLRDVLTLQSELATAIAREIRVKLTPGEKQRLASVRTVDPEAYLAYSYGRFHWNSRTPEGFQKGIEQFQRAIAKDPSYAPAYAGLADVFALLGSIGIDALPPREVMPKAKAAALQAVKLDETLAEGHTSLGYALLSYDWDLAGAEREFKRAIELNPGYATAHHWYAHYFLAKARLLEAMTEMKRAQALDPFSPSINMGVGWCLYHARRYDEAIAQYRATLEMMPAFSLAHGTLGMAYAQKGLHAKAIAEFEKASELAGSTSFATFGLVYTKGLAGMHAEVRKALAALEKASSQRYVPAVYRAAIYAAIGDKNASIEWANKAYDERSDY